MGSVALCVSLTYTGTVRAGLEETAPSYRLESYRLGLGETGSPFRSKCLATATNCSLGISAVRGKTNVLGGVSGIIIDNSGSIRAMAD